MNRRVRIAILVMGFSGLVAEILLLRELLIVFSGNELSIGVILANWLILEAFGCFFPGRLAEKPGSPVEAFSVITVLFSVSLPAAILLTRLLKSLLGVSIGESIGFFPMLYGSFFVLMPVSMLHGALFTFSCRMVALCSGREDSSAGRVYAYETVGTIAGGVVCTYLLIPHLNALTASVVLAGLSFAACLFLLAPSWETGRLQRTMVVVLGVGVLASGSLVLSGQVERLHEASVQAQWGNQHVLHYQNSRYGNICLVENEGQYIYFLDGVPSLMTPIPDIPFVEEFVHLPLLAHPEPEGVLVLSGGAGGVIHEALKHPSVGTVEYAELDPLILELLRRYPTPLTESELNDERVRIRHVDGRLLLKTTRNRYDVILVGIQEPSNLQANRFFTEAFFSLAKDRLNPAGILVVGLPGSLTYASDALKDLNSCIFHTLKRVFSNVRVIPGESRNLFLSSDARDVLTIDRDRILRRLDRRPIQAEVLLPWRIEQKLHPGWQAWFAHFTEGGSRKINADFKPLGVFYSIAHWNALLAPELRGLFSRLERVSLRGVAVSLLALLLLYFLLRWRHVQFSRAGIPWAIVTTGFSGMIFDLMLIFAFQAMYGYVFSWIGLLVAFFMAGAAGGAMVTTRFPRRAEDCLGWFRRMELALVCWALGWPLLFLAIHGHSGTAGAFVLSKALFLVVSILCGLLVGAQFPLANRIYLQGRTSASETAGLLYASDLLGGWLGGMAGAVVLLPVLGLIGTSITVGLLKLTSFAVVAMGPAGCPEGETA